LKTQITSGLFAMLFLIFNTYGIIIIIPERCLLAVDSTFFMLL